MPTPSLVVDLLLAAVVLVLITVGAVAVVLRGRVHQGPAAPARPVTGGELARRILQQQPRR